MSKRMIDSELIEALGTDIKFDGTGNVTIGKNLEVGGTTKLNGGIKPIHTYKWSLTQEGMKWDYTLESLYETQEGSLGYTIFNGYLRIHVKEVSVSQDYAIIGEYNAFGGQMNELSGITFGGYPVTSITEGTDLELFSYNSTTNTATFTKYALANKIPPKLYMHQITLSNAEGTSKRFQYITPRQVVANSIDNLTSLLGNMDVYLDTVQVLHKAGNDWRVVGNSENFVVSSVSDVMTPLEN